MSDEIKSLLESQARAFEEFKSKQDTVIAEEIKKGTADVVRKEEVERIGKSVLDVQDEIKALRRDAVLRGMGEGDRVSPEKKAHAEAFRTYLKTGAGEAELAELQRKALTTTTGETGGFAVPELIDSTIENLVKIVTPVRAAARVIRVATPDYKQLVNVRGTASGWVGETATRPETTAPQLREVPASMGEIYANPAATQTMLEDVFFNAEAWLADEVSTQFAQAEGVAFISGDGTNKPKGFTTYTTNTSADATRTFGHLQMVITGVAGGFVAVTTSTSPADTFIQLVYQMKPEHRAVASWMIGRPALASIMTFKTTDGDYIWRPGLATGQPSTIMGYPVLEAEDMPAVATNTLPIAFGDWRRGYTVVDRRGASLLRDPYTNKPYIHFYSTKRVGGMVVNSEAIKFIATRT